MAMAMAMCHVFALQVIRSRNLATLHVIVAGQRRQREEIALVTGRLVSLIEQKLPRAAILNIMSNQGHGEGLLAVWSEWVDVALLHYNARHRLAAGAPWPTE